LKNKLRVVKENRVALWRKASNLPKQLWATRPISRVFIGSVSRSLLPSGGQGSQKGSLLLEEAKEGSQKGATADTWTTLSFIGAWIDDHRDNRHTLSSPPLVEVF
jgi:hypothetical protein